MGRKVGLGMEQGLGLTAKAGLWGLSKSCHPSRKEFVLTWPTDKPFLPLGRALQEPALPGVLFHVGAEPCFERYS